MTLAAATPDPLTPDPVTPEPVTPHPVTPDPAVEAAGPSRPVAMTAGSATLIGAWLIGLAIARLTGAVAVVVLLVASAVALAAAVVAGWARLRAVHVTGIVAPTTVDAGAPFDIAIDHGSIATSTVPVVITSLGRFRELGSTSPTAMTVAVDDPGVVASVDISLECAGLAGLVVWRRRARVGLDPIHVAPAAHGPSLGFDERPARDEGSAPPSKRPGVEGADLDGMRAWRAGESEGAIHWPSSIRSRELVVHDRPGTERARRAVALDADPARLRWTLQEGLRLGDQVVLLDTRSGGDTVEIPITAPADALRWSAIAAERARRGSGDAATGSRRPRSARRVRPPERTTVPRPARCLGGLAALVALWMLQSALAAPLAERAMVAAGVAVGVAISVHLGERERPWWLRSMTAFVAMAALGRIATEASGIGGLLEALRGPLPDLLILLVVLHGVEIADRRTHRVHLAITAVVVAYAAGLKVGGDVGWWSFAWGALVVTAFCTTATRVRSPSVRSFVRTVSWTAAGGLATLGVGALVPVPSGPASIGLPALSTSPASVSDGSLLSAGGDLGTAGGDGSSTSPTRGALGRAGGSRGFSDTLDTSVRGDLGDEVVMRVRATRPSFWRGQTFTRFDGRVWTADEETGRRLEGPSVRLDPTLGDVASGGVDVDVVELVQTFYVEADLPNVVFAAPTATAVVLDGAVFARSDGALRTDRALTAGSAYSVVSEQPRTTPATLRAQGDVADRFAPAADHPEIARLLELPSSTTRRTIALADELRVEGSTYDTVRAYEAWLAANTSYDLDAPVPAGDAVDDFLFGARRGFCEQIASTLVVMLRSQGVPARLATGYVPGDRDRLSGVFEVRARDAHAWVEVWFPETGWEAFDPTASVPLAGEVDGSTIGSEVATSILAASLGRPLEIGAVVAGLVVGVSAWRALIAARARRRRGAWGVLHDRFAALEPDAVTAPRVAAALSSRLGEAPGADPTEPARVAATLDRVAFDPDHVPDDDELARTARSIAALEATTRSLARRRHVGV